MNEHHKNAKLVDMTTTHVHLTHLPNHLPTYLIKFGHWRQGSPFPSIGSGVFWRASSVQGMTRLPEGSPQPLLAGPPKGVFDPPKGGTALKKEVGWGAPRNGKWWGHPPWRRCGGFSKPTEIIRRPGLGQGVGWDLKRLPQRGAAERL